MYRRYRAAEIAFTALIAAIAASSACGDTPAFDVRVISSRPDFVSGGNALVRLRVVGDFAWTARLNGRDVTAAFRTAGASGDRLALLQGLKFGKNTLEMRVAGEVRLRLELVNHPRAGPVFAGPHQEPFICRTEENGLGPALDAVCSASTVVRYYYKSTLPLPRDSPEPEANGVSALRRGFKVHDPKSPLPSDVATTVTTDGRTVPYIVRREAGVINRGVYDIRFLHQPGQPLPTPWSGPTPGWNGRLLYGLGPGCGAGYHQGALEPAGRSTALEQGYAVATSTLNKFGDNCNHKLAAETLSMVKEYFIEQFGAPAHTIGSGGSGGALQGQLIAQDYPGLLDGLLIGGSFPDAVTYIQSVTDCPLLDRAFETSTQSWSKAQKTAVSGFATWNTCGRDRGPPKRRFIDPMDCNAAIPKEMTYDATARPHGVRCDVYNNAIRVFGRSPRTGRAYRPLDNVGVQYGLIAFNRGIIDAERFVDLNERIGGFDEDAHLISGRMSADPEGVRLAYKHGLVLTGAGGLAATPIIDSSWYSDDMADNHDRVRAFITRARLIAANGRADNHVILVNPRPELLPFLIPERQDDYFDELAERDKGLLPQLSRWLMATATDTTRGTLAEKVARNRPGDLADGCLAVNGERIVEAATYDAPSRCNLLYPPHGHPRIAAGAPLAGDILKCALKPIDLDDYAQPLSPRQLERLRAVFSTGVCNYGRPGIGQSDE